MDISSFSEKFTNRNLTIIGLILVIILGIYFIGGVGASDNPTEEQAQKYCENKCNNIKNSTGELKRDEAYNYCKEKFEIKTSPLKETENKEGESEFCSDGTRCSNINTCEVEGIGDLDMQGCINLMDSYHEERLGESESEARSHTMALLSEENKETGVGSCEPKPEWYQELEANR